MFLAALMCIAAGGWYGQTVPFSEQWPMYEALRTTAAIIFAVIGAWLAIIYPERLKLSIRDPQRASESDGRGMGKLFTPVVNSTAILCIILVVGVAAPILKRHDVGIPLEVIRGCSYGLLVALTIWQLWTVILTLVPASNMKALLDHEGDRASVLQDLNRVSQRGKK